MGGILADVSVAAATAVVGYDLLQNNRKRVSSRIRAVTGFVLVGSAAINDTEVDVYAGDYYFGRFRNTRAGVVAPVIPDDYQAVRGTVIAPGDQITATVVDAPATNPIILQVYGEERG